MRWDDYERAKAEIERKLADVDWCLKHLGVAMPVGWLTARVAPDEVGLPDAFSEANQVWLCEGPAASGSPMYVVGVWDLGTAGRVTLAPKQE